MNAALHHPTPPAALSAYHNFSIHIFFRIEKMTILIIKECAFFSKSAFICFFRDNDIRILKRWIIIINRASLSKRILSFI